ncbi:unnamed protein product, partial [Mesorhabditis spiculigera]
MAYFRNFFGGGGSVDPDDNGAEIVERLVERVETCTALEDRRDALRALRNMAKKQRLAVGTLGLGAFMEILTKERSAIDLLSLTLEVLLFVLIGDDDAPEEDELGERLAEVMLKRPEFIAAVLSTLEQFEFSIRRVSVQLLTALLRHRGAEVQNAVIGQPMGVSRLVDLIHDNREVVRNEAILLLCELSRAHSQLQQLLAYDSAFTILLDIVESEPIDSIVIEDCLFVILNLLRKNPNNQQLFRENNLIARLGGLLHNFVFPEETDETAEWAKQRTANLIFLFQVIRALVSPDNLQENIHAAQKIMHQTQILSELCRVLLSEIGVSVEILTETVIAVAEVIRGNYVNQEYFASNSLLTTDGSPRPALLVLLLSMTAERQPFKLRCAVFYAFLSYLHDNEFGKTKIIETLLPQAHAPPDSLSTGGLVIQALTSSEAVQSWFGSVCLLHCLLDVDHLGEQLLRVQFSMTVDEQPQLLLSHLIRMLISLGVRRPQQRAGLLQLLAVWSLRTPSVVGKIFADGDFMNYLTTHIVEECGEGSDNEQAVARGLAATLLLILLQNASDEKTKSSIDALVKRRVGATVIADAVEGVASTEPYVRAAQKAQPLAKQPGDLFLDHHFIKIFKNSEHNLVRLVRSKEAAGGPTNDVKIIESYKDLIKRQDEEISVLKTDYKRSKEELEGLKGQLSSVGQLQRQLAEANAKLEQKQSSAVNTEQLQQQVAHLTGINQQWQAEVEKYKGWAQQWQTFQIGQLPNGGADHAVHQLQAQVTELEQQLGYGYQAYEAQAQQIQQHIAAAQSWQQRSEAFEAEVQRLKAEIEQQKSNGPTTYNATVNGHAAHDGKTEEELKRVKEEQEDLLVLLADQHNKLSSYKKRLRALAQPVSEDEDDD